DLVHLDVAIATLQRLIRVVPDGSRLAIPQKARVGRNVRALAAAKQAVERQPRYLAGDVPERDVDPGQPIDDGTVTAAAVECALDVERDVADGGRIAPDAERRDQDV